jgi:hypothetical protein
MPNKYTAIPTFGYLVIDRDGNTVAVCNGIATEWMCSEQASQAVESLENKHEDKENTQ